MSLPLLLQLVGAQLVQQADPPALLGHVEEHAQPLAFDEIERGRQLFAAIAAQRVEHVSGEALGMHPHQHVLLTGHVSLHQGQVLLAVEQALVAVGRELTRTWWACFTTATCRTSFSVRRR